LERTCNIKLSLHLLKLNLSQFKFCHFVRLLYKAKHFSFVANKMKIRTKKKKKSQFLEKLHCAKLRVLCRVTLDKGVTTLYIHKPSAAAGPVDSRCLPPSLPVLATSVLAAPTGG